MESLSIGEIRVVDGRILWLVEGFDEDGRAICRHKLVKSHREEWSGEPDKLLPRILMGASKHYGYLDVNMENE
jgi:hypothetical protein